MRGKIEVSRDRLKRLRRGEHCASAHFFRTQPGSPTLRRSDIKPLLSKDEQHIKNCQRDRPLPNHCSHMSFQTQAKERKIQSREE